MKMCLGAQLYTVRDYMKTEADYRMMMKKIAEIGYKTVQMSGYNTAEITPAVIKEVTEENNLKVVLTYTDAYGEGDELNLAGLTIKVLHTPGHTPGSVCLRCEDTLFAGDTLFQAINRFPGKKRTIDIDVEY